MSAGCATACHRASIHHRLSVAAGEPVKSSNQYAGPSDNRALCKVAEPCQTYRVYSPLRFAYGYIMQAIIRRASRCRQLPAGLTLRDRRFRLRSWASLANLAGRSLIGSLRAAGQCPDQVADPGDLHHLLDFLLFFVFAAHRLIQLEKMRPVGRRIFAATKLQPADGTHRPPHSIAAILRRAVGTELNDEPLDFLPRFGGGRKFFVSRVEFFGSIIFFALLFFLHRPGSAADIGHRQS